MEQLKIFGMEQLENVRQVPYIILADGGFGLSDYLTMPFLVPTTTTIERSYNAIRLSLFNIYLAKISAYQK